VTKTLIAEGFDVMTVEPNVKAHNEFKIHSIEDALQQADIVVYLVAHKEFFRIEKSEKAIDFCGVYK